MASNLDILFNPPEGQNNAGSQERADYIKKILRQAGMPVTGDIDINTLLSGNPNRWKNSTPEQRQLAGSVNSAIDAIRSINLLKRGVNPGDEQSRTFFNSRLEQEGGKVAELANYLDILGVDQNPLKDLYKYSSQAGYNIAIPEGGGPAQTRIDFVTPPVVKTPDEKRRDLLPTQEPNLTGQPQVSTPSPVPQINPGIQPLPAANPPIRYQPTPVQQPQPLIPPQPIQQQSVQQPIAPNQPQPLVTNPGTVPGNTQVPIAGNTQVPTVRRDIPSYIDPDTDRARIEQEAVRQQDQAKAVAEAEAQAYLQAIQQYQQGLSGLRPTVEAEASRQFGQAGEAARMEQGILGSALSQYQQGIQGIRPLIESEAGRQYTQLSDLATQQDLARQQRLADTERLLSQRQNRLFQEATPLLAEQAQTAGLLQSSGFGEALGREFKGLSAQTQEQLGLQSLADRDALLQAQQQALGQRQTLQGFGLEQGVMGMQDISQRQLAAQGLEADRLNQALAQRQQLQAAGLDLSTGLQTDVAGKLFGAEQQRIQDITDILGRRQQLQLSGLQREFSTADLEESARLAQQYGLQMAPQSGGGGNVFGSLLGGAATGAALGSVIPGIGTGIGAAAGAGLGLLGGKKKGK